VGNKPISRRENFSHGAEMRDIYSAFLTSIFLFTIVGCGIGVDPGSVSLSLAWDEPPAGVLWLWVRVEERSDPTAPGLILSSAGPAEYHHGLSLQMDLPGVDNGDNRFVIVEAREDSNPGLAVLYYGISDSFSVEAGKRSIVDVPLMLQQPETQKFAATIELVVGGESPDTLGLDDARQVSVRTRSVATQNLLLANDPSFSSNLTTIDLDQAECSQEEIEGVTWDICMVTEWDLTAGLPSLGDGLYSIYARFVDRNGYESLVHKDSVFVDSTSPQLLFASLSPTFAGAGETVALSVTFHEEIEIASGGALLEVFPESAFAADFQGPERVGTSTTYLWTAQIPETASEDDNTYAFEVAVGDPYSNISDSQALTDIDGMPVELRVDGTPPTLVDGALLNFGKATFGIPKEETEPDTVRFDFVLRDGNPHQVSGEEGELCQGTCPEVRLGTKGVGSVLRAPALDDPSQDRLGFSFSYIILLEDWGNVDLELDISITWSDLAGNSDEVSPDGATVHLDFIRPTGATCLMTPEVAKAGDTLLYSVTSTELLCIDPEVLVAGATQDLLVDSPTVSSGGLTYTWTVPAEAVQADSVEFGAVLTDLAGNESLGPVCEVVTSVDVSPPVLSEGELSTDPLVLNSEGEPLQIVGDGDLLDAQFLVTENQTLAPGFPEVYLDVPGAPLPFELTLEHPKADQQTIYVYQLKLAEGLEPNAEGYWPVRVVLRDVAGNVTVEPALAGDLVRVDFTSPSATCNLGPLAAKVGEEITLTVNCSEDLLGSGPLLQADIPFEGPVGSGLYEYKFTHQVKPGDPDVPSYSYAVSITDLAGNSNLGPEACTGQGSIDTTAPSIVGGVDGIFVSAEHLKDQQTVEVSFTITGDEPLATPPVVLVGSTPMAHVGGEAGEFLFEHLVDSAGEPPDAEGIWPISITIEDVAGNQAFFTPSTVAYDFSKPQLMGSPTIQLTPGPDCPVGSISAVGAGSAVDVSFTVDGVLSKLPEVTLEGAESGVLSLANIDPANPYRTTFSYHLVEGEGGTVPLRTEETVVLKAILEDLAGNQTTLELFEVAVDTKPPQLLDVETPGRVVYTRIPWGSEVTDGVKRFYVRGGVGAVESDARVVIFDGPEPATAAQIGFAQAAPDGSFGAQPGEAGAVLLSPADRSVVYVAAVDGGCNISGVRGVPSAVQVLDTEWVQTMGYKVPGNSLGNPNVFASTSWFTERFTQEDIYEPEESGKLGVPAEFAEVTGGGEWTNLEISYDYPEARFLTVSWWDPISKRAHFFGGASSGDLFNDLWATDGATWQKIEAEDPEQDGAPPPMQFHAAAYDMERGRLVLYGGTTINEGRTGELWEWDGRSWAHVWPNCISGSGPAGVEGHSLTYVHPDPSGLPFRHTVLFGGLTRTSSGSSAPSAKLWGWDGADWTLLHNGVGGPPPRYLAAAGFDPVRSRLVIYGGTSDKYDKWNASLGDTWEWDGEVWHEVTPTDPEGDGNPPLLAGAVMTWFNGRIHLFGGHSTGGSNGYSDLWAWDGQSWGLVWDGKNKIPDAMPVEVYAPGLVANHEKGELLVFSGQDVGSREAVDSLWRWRSNQWELAETPAEDAGYWPPAGSEVTATYDPDHDIGWFCGGSGNIPLWSWDGCRFREAVVSDPSADGNPSTFQGSALAWDAQNQQLIFYEQMNSSSGSNGGTWLWQDPDWILMKSADPDNEDSPSPREHPCMAWYEGEDRQAVVLFGGKNGKNQSLAETWEWDGVSWTLVEPIDPEGDGNPPALGSCQMVYVSQRGTVAMNDENFSLVWEWNGTSWRKYYNQGDMEPPDQGGDPPDMVYDDERDKIVVVTGKEDAIGTEDLWEWDWKEWSIAGVADPGDDGRPASVDDRTAIYDVSRKETVVFGGASKTGEQDLDDAWAWRAGSSQRPGHILSVPLELAAIEAKSIDELQIRWKAGAVGGNGEAPATGATLMAWMGGMWTSVAANDAALDNPSELFYSTDTMSEIRSLVSGSSETLSFASVPVDTNGNGYARLRTYYVELTLRYRSIGNWIRSGDLFALAKDDCTHFSERECADEVFDDHEVVREGVLFRVGPYSVGANMAALPPVIELEVPDEARRLKHVHLLVPGRRGTSEKSLAVDFIYTDGTSASTGNVVLPHDCVLGEEEVSDYYLLKHQGIYIGPCCGNWYYGRFTNPNPDLDVAAVVPTFSGCLWYEANGFIWALTLERWFPEPSCDGQCGDGYDQAKSCQCDSLCFSYGDCCLDICDVCTDIYPVNCD
jgi:hypothetical protein